MRQRMIILTSIFISAAVLVVIGAVSTNVFAQKNAAPTPSATELAQAYQAREDSYNKLIADANQKLEEANNNLQDMQNQIASLQTQVQANNPAAASTQKPGATAISAKDAAQIAEKVSVDLIPPAKTPELVDFQGKTAFEVVFSKGSIYVDAQSGEVLFNGTVPQKITSNQAVTIATDYIKSTDVTQVDQITFNKILLFRVIFRPGYMVYIDMTGQIIYVNMGPSVVQVPSGGNGSTSSSSSGSSSSGYHGGGDDGGGD
jgi:hypothetical protein